MLRLSTPKEEWHDVRPGVRILFAPVTRKAWRAAQSAAAAAYRDAGYAAGDQAPDEVTEEAGDAISRVLLERGILDWQGVGDEAGVALPVTPESVAAFLAHPLYFTAADAAYVGPWVSRMQEGNVSAGSPSGTSVAETPEPITAASPVPVQTDAESAPTGSTSSGRRKRRASGKS